MKIIKKIEITKFRSIFRETIDASDLTVFSGKNNSGKSNVLRALNLFFNNESSFKQPYQHERDYNKAYTGRVGNKREIEIKIHFFAQGKGALEKDFCIAKKFSQEGISAFEYSYPDNPEDITDGNVRRQFTKFLKKLEYVYIPAVRDKNFVRELLLLFEKIIEDGKGNHFKDIVRSLSEILGEKSQQISVDFEKFINLPTKAELSSDIVDILGAVRVNVESGIKIQRKGGAKREHSVLIDLFSSGDGVLMSYIPHFLYHISEKIKDKYFIWGFEEPENSLEYNRIETLASKISSEFIKQVQIFITSHSPAFISLDDPDRILLYRVYIEPLDTKQSSHIVTISKLKEAQLTLFQNEKSATPEFLLLQQEIGIVELARRIHSQINEENNILQERLKEITCPVIFTEGNNVDYLEKAKLFFDKNGCYMIKDGKGKNDLRKLFSHFLDNVPAHKVIFVWDPDCKSSVDSMLGNSVVLPLVLEKSLDHKNGAGVESLFSKKWFTDDVYYKEEGNLHGTGTTNLDKKKFKDKILDQGTEIDFINFKETFEVISKFLKST